MANKTVIRILTENKLKVTPQRAAILEVLLSLKNHPTAEDIINYLRISYPAISLATVYKSLDLFVSKRIIEKINTSGDIMRYDTFKDPHHHLYCSDSDQISDFYDEKINEILENHFSKNPIPGFNIEDIKLQIIGRFKDKQTK